MVLSTATNPATGERLLMVGLSLGDLKDLSFGKPLAIDMATVEEGVTNIMIFSGTTDQDIADTIAEKIPSPA